MSKSLPVVAPILTSILNEKDKKLWNKNRRLFGFDIILFQESLKQLTIGSGAFIFDGIVVEFDVQQILTIPDALFTGGLLLGTESDPTILFSTTPDNVEASGSEFSFLRQSSIPDVDAVAFIARYDGESWEAVEGVAVGEVLDLAVELKGFVGDVSPLQSILNQGVGANFDEAKVKSDRISFRSISFIADGKLHDLNFEEAIFQEASNLDAADSILLREGSWYYLYGTSDADVKWSLVPPVLGTRPAWIPGDQGFALVDTIQILSLNQKIKINVNGTSHTATIPAATYLFRDLLNKIMDDSIWSNSRAPIHLFDFGNTASPSTRFVGLIGAEGSGNNQTIKLETISNSIYATLGWTSFVDVSRTGTEDTFAMSVLNDGALGLLPVQVSDFTRFEGRAAGQSTSALKIAEFNDATSFPQVIDIADFVPSKIRYAKILITATAPTDVTITSRESTSDISLSQKDIWEGDVSVGRSRELSFTATIGSSEFLRVFVVGYKE